MTDVWDIDQVKSSDCDNYAFLAMRSGWEEWKIVCFRPDGSIFATIQHTHAAFDWNREGTKLVYFPIIPGQNRSARTTGLRVFDISRGDYEELPLDELNLTWNPDLYPDLAWPAFDNCIYVHDGDPSFGHVFRFDPTSQEWATTPYSSVDFSPDGKYYFVEESESVEPPHLFLRETNEDITARKDYLTAKTSQWCRGWFSNRHLVFGGPDELVLDCEDGFARRIPGKVAALLDDGKEVVYVTADREVKRAKLADFRVVTAKELDAEEEAFRQREREKALRQKPEREEKKKAR